MAKKTDNMNMIDTIPLIPPAGPDRVRNSIAGWNAKASQLQSKLRATTNILRMYQNEPEMHLGYGDSGNTIFQNCNGGTLAYSMNLGFLFSLLQTGVQLAQDSGQDAGPWQELLDRSKMHLRASAARWLAPFTIAPLEDKKQ